MKKLPFGLVLDLGDFSPWGIDKISKLPDFFNNMSD